VLSTDVPIGESEPSGGEGFDEDSTGDNCPLSDGLDSFVLQNQKLYLTLFDPLIIERRKQDALFVI